MRLADFILTNIEPILMDWEVFARSIAPGATMDALALRDHAGAILRATTDDMKSAQTDAQRSAEAKGHRRDGGGGIALNGASELHAVGRLGSGFDLLEVVSEYRALRASVLPLWHESKPQPHERDVSDLTRFNESIDQSLAKAVMSYTQKVDQSRDLFLAILSHDLRNPLNSIAMSAQMLPLMNKLDSESVEMTSQIAVNVSVMGRMINDLLDYTRTRLGAGMPVNPEPMDAGKLCRALFDEFRSANPSRLFNFAVTGDLNGQWDSDRLRQAVSNLMGNAVQHGSATEPVGLKLNGEGPGLIIEVRNGGPPIPLGELPRIFEPLIRGASAQQHKKNRLGSIGLGLYIAREVAISHGGRIDVTSTQANGTAFTIHLPRISPQRNDHPILDEKHIETM
jgi:signal transduction histidine kinase